MTVICVTVLATETVSCFRVSVLYGEAWAAASAARTRGCIAE